VAVEALADEVEAAADPGELEKWQEDHRVIVDQDSSTGVDSSIFRKHIRARVSEKPQIVTAPALRDPGPMARLEELKSAPDTMSVIVQRLADGETLPKIAKSWDVPYGKLAEWITEDADRAEQYARGKRLAVHALADQVIEIADDIDEKSKNATAKARVRIHARQWAAEKWAPERFGPRASLDVAVKDNRTPLEREAKVLELARTWLYVLKEAGDIRARRGAAEPAALPAPIEGESRREESPPGDSEPLI